MSRWVEDWTNLREAGKAPPLKATPIGDGSLTLSGEVRLRFDRSRNTQLSPGKGQAQGLLRGVLGANLRIDPHVRVYTEIATGQVEGDRSTATPNFQNDASLQQMFVELSANEGSMLVGAMVGRQEFSDGPRQLVSVSDGPNIHRTWNGLRLYAHGRGFRMGAFDLRVTRPGRGSFDEKADNGERLQGLNASIAMADTTGPGIYLDPFWFHTRNPGFRSVGRTGVDTRDTYGARLWGRRGDLSFDWTAAHQTGRSLDREVHAWALFAVQSLALSKTGWKPRLTAHVDIASGGGNDGDPHAPVKEFNQLYASSAYLGEGLFLSASNLLLAAPGVAFSPTPSTSMSIEYGLARKKLDRRGAAYAGQMRTYAGTQNVPGQDIGGLLRISGSWAASEYLTVFFDYEHLAAGDVLKRASLRSGTYSYVGATWRY